MAAQCQTVYGTTVETLTSLITSTVTQLITAPPTTSAVTSTSITRVCQPCTPQGSASTCAPACSTSTVLIPETTIIPGSVATSTSVGVETLTSLSSSKYPVATSCYTPPPTQVTTPPAPAPQPVTTPTTTHSSSTSIQVVVVTTTLADGQTSTFSSSTPILVPAGSDLSSTSDSSVPTGAIVGATLGGAAAAILILLLVLGCWKRIGPFSCLSSVSGSDTDGLDEEYWAPAVHASSSADDEEVLDKAGGGRSSTVGSHEDMVEFHSGAYHRRSLSGGAAGFQRSSSTFSYMSEPSRPRSPPLHYPSGPPSMHSSPSYYSTYPSIVTTSAPGAAMYYAAPYPVTTAEQYHSTLVRHSSAGSLPPGSVTAAPYYVQNAPVQRSRSAHSARTLSYMQGQRLSQWEEGDETPHHAQEEATSTEGTAGSPLSPVPAEGVMPFSQRERPLSSDAQVLAEGSWLGGAISERSH